MESSLPFRNIAVRYIKVLKSSVCLVSVFVIVFCQVEEMCYQHGVIVIVLPPTVETGQHTDLTDTISGYL